ncbi:MAG: helix-turn-helix domain-containing protein [Erysipelotrichaceae bacterium]|nr:helix-turn-helix domain-containing protein [Erysipelotrichaceae bacterium]
MSALSYTDNTEYLQRKERLTECLLKRMSAEEIVHEAAVQYCAPVILTTSLYRVIVMDDLGMEVNDPVWETARDTGYCSSDNIADFEIQGITHDVLNAQSSFILDRGVGQYIPRILMKIMINGIPAAYIGIFQTGRPFSETDLRITDYLCEVLSLVLERDPGIMPGGITVHESILTDLLDGTLTSPTVLNDRMRTAYWTAKAVFQCVLITPAHKSSGIDNSAYLKSKLTGVFPSSHLVQVPEGILLVLNEDSFRPERYKHLQDVVQQFDLFMNISEPFRNLILLRHYYESCRAIRDVARKQKREGRITELKDVYYDVLSGLLKKEEKMVLCQTEYRNLLDYDTEHKTDYVVTLETYIEHGCSVTDTANTLFIHRNTMAKRLDRIKEICGLDPADGTALIRFYLSSRMMKK